ncbi:MAG: type I-E CRISPR-associated protein Cas6/Cse3/CasE [Hyphomicrobiales bacterium]|uniref:type I-E CRISPR-associated protein Cas6/Cse3/CasE n=1 Tax=Rhabdaerophilum calidifontis TaxID=2604328 RepID=UPI001239E666|nr:type I-E CRISPR-associated protein Cas6/Cse3/CasE [Rhabdaerophilum calidifontis]MCA1951551.1 type I-E CRISPR-associated protein Cas6/Cse3/CasE [Hyphomicrobiales bacterium]MCA1998513.1 type I-E CRISPR-associated protein Cas6/Cse3/CasE [Hyphomicrobiales bacterium]
MTLLHMLSLPVDLRELRRWSASCGLEADEGRALHHLLCETFGKGVAQPFRLMPGRGGACLAHLYSYTSASQQALRQTAAETGLPESARIFDMAGLATKAMPETWTPGRRLAFDVRLRPVRRLNNDLQGWSRETARIKTTKPATPLKAGSEVDAFLVARLRANPRGLPETGGPSREEIYRDWFRERLAGAATVDDAGTRLVSHERSIVLRGGQRIEGPDAILHGALVIENPDLFARLLARGAGRHTAYGYGMMLLRPEPR